MNKFYDTLTNQRGDILPGGRLQVVTSAGAIVPIFADDSGTPFTDANGSVVNYAVADLEGLVQFYWDAAAGQILQQLDISGKLLRTVTDFAKRYLLADLAGDIPQSRVTDLTTDLAAKLAAADLASTDPGKGAALVGFRRIPAGTTRDVADFIASLAPDIEDFTGADDQAKWASALAWQAANPGNALRVTRDYTLTATIATTDLYLVLQNGPTVTGHNGTGFLLSTGACRIIGEGTITGFEDNTGNGWEYQKNNFDTCVIRVADGEQITSGELGRDILFMHNRGAFKAALGGTENSYDENASVRNFSIHSTFEYGAYGVKIWCEAFHVEANGATFRHLRSASRTGLTGIEIFPSGDPTKIDDTQTTGNVVMRCMFDDIVQCTTTGDSTPGNNYECNGCRMAGYGGVIAFNFFRQITGVETDCEAVYTKGVGVNVYGNFFYNAGTIEGAIAIKGAPTGATGAGQNPGIESRVFMNYLLFDQYTYTHDGPTYDSSGAVVEASGEVVALDRRGIYIPCPDHADVSFNTVRGANEVDYYLSVSAAVSSRSSRGLSGTGNKSVQSRSGTPVLFYGQLDNPQFHCAVIDPNPAGAELNAIRLQEVPTRGPAARSYDLSGCRMVMNEESALSFGASDTEFPFYFEIEDTTDLIVSGSVDGTFTLTTDYTVELNDNQVLNPGGLITFTSARGAQTVTASRDRTGLIISMLYVSGGTIPIDGVILNDVVFDVIASGSVVIPVQTSSTGSVTATFDGFEMKRWHFPKDNQFQRLLALGTWRPRSYEIDVVYQSVTTDNANLDNNFTTMITDAVAIVDYACLMQRVDVPGNPYYTRIKSLYRDVAGTPTSVGTPTTETIGTALSGVSAVLGVNSENLRIRLNGSESETYRFHNTIKVSQIPAA